MTWTCCGIFEIINAVIKLDLTDAHYHHLRQLCSRDTNGTDVPPKAFVDFDQSVSAVYFSSVKNPKALVGILTEEAFAPVRVFE